MNLKSYLYKFLLILLILLSFGKISFAQLESDVPNRWYFGGNLGANFGYVTDVEISPLVGYRLNHNFYLGAGMTYIYYSVQDPNYSYDNYTTSMYGLRFFAKEMVYRNIFAYAELEFLNLNEPDPFGFSPGLFNRTVETPFIGAGFSQPLGGSAFTYLMVLWNLNNTDPFSPYYFNPVIRVGFIF
jgi:hypothetical protein